MRWDDAAGDTVGPRYFNLEPDGFAVIGGGHQTVEYVDPGIRSLLPMLHGQLATSADESARRVAEVARQVLETGVAALVKGLTSTRGGSVDLMLKRIDAEGGRRVLALARIAEAPAAEPPPAARPLSEPPLSEPPPAAEPAAPPQFTRVGPAAPPETEPVPTVTHAATELRPEPVAIAAGASPVVTPSIHPPSAHGPEPVSGPEAFFAAEPVAASPAPPVSGPGSFAAVAEQIGLSLQSTADVRDGLEVALRDAAVALGCSTASLMLRRNFTSVVEVTYGMDQVYQGLRFRDDEAPHERMAKGAGDVIAIEDTSADRRVHSERLAAGGILAVLAVPLLSSNERVGVLYFNWSEPQRFGHEQRAFVRSISSLMAPHAQVLRLLRVVDRETTYVTTLLDSVRAVSSGGMRSSIAASVLEVLHDRLGLDYGDIRIGEDRQRLHTLATLHGHETVPSNGVPAELGQQALSEGRMVTGRTKEAPEDRDLDGIRHISVPFDVMGGGIGVMDLSFLGSRRFAADEMALFGAVGRLLSLSLGRPDDLTAWGEAGRRCRRDAGGLVRVAPCLATGWSSSLSLRVLPQRDELQSRARHRGAPGRSSPRTGPSARTGSGDRRTTGSWAVASRASRCRMLPCTSRPRRCGRPDYRSPCAPSRAERSARRGG